MNILHVTQGYSPAIGGTEWLIQRVSEELANHCGDQVTVFTTDRLNVQGFVRPFSPRLHAGWEEIHGVKVRRFRVWNAFGLLLKVAQLAAYQLNLPFNDLLRSLYSGPIIPGFEREIRKYPADLIGAASFPLLHMFAAQNAARRSRRPCVLTGCLHPEDRWGFQRSQIYQAVRNADAYVALTGYEADYVASLGLDPERVFVAGGGVDPSPYQNIPPVEAKQHLGIDPQKPVVGYIGQLVGHKGIDVLLRAMPQVWSQKPETCLLVAGSKTTFQHQLDEIMQDWPEDYRRRTIFKYNFPDEEKPFLFNAIDIFAYPSVYESFGIAFLEAWASAKPVVGCRRGAISTVVQHGVDGILVEERTEKQLAGAVLRLLCQPEEARAMGLAGKQKVYARYTWPEVARKFRDAYQFARERYRVP
jgi:glycosyltransferase involved in cell wall biosynthesis